MNSRLPGADLLRALATIVVIVTHASHWPQQTLGLDHAVWTDVDQCTRFAVPAFLVLSGVVLAYRHGDRALDGGFLIRRARRSLLPFIVWAPVYLMTGLFITDELPREQIVSWLALGAGHLYFLLIIPQFYLIYLVWPRRRTWAPRVAIGALALQLALCAWRLYGDVPAGLAFTLVLTGGYEFFPFWIGYFALGLWLGHTCAEHGDDRRGLALIAVGAIVPAAAVLLMYGTSGSPHPDYGDGTGGFLLPLLPPLVVAVCVAALFGGTAVLAGSARLRRAVELLSAYSLGVYIVHPLLLRIPARLLYTWLIYNSLPGTIPATVLLVAMTLLLSLLAVRALAATPLAITVGVPRSPLRRPARRGPDG